MTALINGGTALAIPQSDREMLKNSVAKTAKLTDAEFELFIRTCELRNLNPLANQIYCFKQADRVVMGASIDGLRAIAHRTGRVDGIETGVTIDDGKIISGWAKIWVKNCSHPFCAEVFFSEYRKTAGPWVTMPRTMIEKVAEAHALRRAFPEDLGGLYTSDEFSPDQPPRDVTPAKKSEADENLENLRQKLRERFAYMSVDEKLEIGEKFKNHFGMPSDFQIKIAHMTLDHIRWLLNEGELEKVAEKKDDYGPRFDKLSTRDRSKIEAGLIKEFGIQIGLQSLTTEAKIWLTKQIDALNK